MRVCVVCRGKKLVQGMPCPVCAGGRSKYRAVPATVDGIRFASKREAARYGQLKLLLEAGHISDLDLQPWWKFIVNGVLVCKYVADFRYKDADGNVVVEDAKGVRTREYRIKKKLLKAVYGIDVREV